MEVKSDAIKKQYCIGTWNVRSMNQGKLEVVKQKMVKVNIDILLISEIKWTEWVNLIQMTIIVGKNPLEKNGVAIIVNKSGQSADQFSHSVVSDSLRPYEQQHTRPPCPSPTSRIHPNPCPLCR